MSYVGKIVTKIKTSNTQTDGKLYLGFGGCELELEKKERMDLEDSYIDEFTVNSIKNCLKYQNIFKNTINYEISKIPCQDLDQYPNYLRFEPTRDDNMTIEKVLVILYEYDEEGKPNGNFRKYRSLGISNGLVNLDKDNGLFIALYRNKVELFFGIVFGITSHVVYF